MSESALRLQLPADRDELKNLRAGQMLLLSGPVYTMRDAGHMRALEYLREKGELPFGLEGQMLFYAGPSPAAAGRPFGAVGPTTASRMDFASPELFCAGIVGAIGKGERGEAVKEACMAYGCVYLAAVGGAASYLARCVRCAQDVAWEDLGTEALRKLELEDFPCFVALDCHGGDYYGEVAR